jgi:hypothetical protein
MASNPRVCARAPERSERAATVKNEERMVNILISRIGVVGLIEN